MHLYQKKRDVKSMLEPVAPYIMPNKHDIGVTNLSIPTEHSTEMITKETGATGLYFNTIKTKV